MADNSENFTAEDVAAIASGKVPILLGDYLNVTNAQDIPLKLVNGVWNAQIKEGEHGKYLVQQVEDVNGKVYLISLSFVQYKNFVAKIRELGEENFGRSKWITQPPRNIPTSLN